MISTSYKSEGMSDLITALVRTVRAKKIIEFGTQQGHSAILLAKGGGKVKTYDSFEKNYPKPPYKETHASLLDALRNVKNYDIQVYKKDVSKVKPVECDILHIDICNHEGNVKDLVEKWYGKAKMIILEGGVKNKWQKKYGFKPFIPEVDHVIIKGDNGYAITIII